MTRLFILKPLIHVRRDGHRAGGEGRCDKEANSGGRISRRPSTQRASSACEQANDFRLIAGKPESRRGIPLAVLC